MKLLLDTQAAAWWWLADPRLPKAACDALADPAHSIFVSAASAGEFATRLRIGKWQSVADIVANLPRYLEESDFIELPIRADHARMAGIMDNPHRDPFDRMIVAQARIEDMIVVSGDPALATFPVRIMWD